jgi:hypothetical protein
VLLTITHAMSFFVSAQEEICLAIRDQTTENVFELNVVGRLTLCLVIGYRTEGH